jgi:hypothetical protein
VCVRKAAGLSSLSQSLEASCRSAWEEALGVSTNKDTPLAQYYQVTYNIVTSHIDMH